MKLTDPAQRQTRCFDFINAQGSSFRIQVIDDPMDIRAFSIHIAPLDTDHSSEKEGAQTRFRLTSRERDIALLVERGYTNIQIADRLCISLSTVKSHLHRILAKTEAPNRTALASILRNQQDLERDA